jgi:hypothetical protein
MRVVQAFARRASASHIVTNLPGLYVHSRFGRTTWSFSYGHGALTHVANCSLYRVALVPQGCFCLKGRGHGSSAGLCPTCVCHQLPCWRGWHKVGKLSGAQHCQSDRAVASRQQSADVHGGGPYGAQMRPLSVVKRRVLGWGLCQNVVSE